MRTALEMRTMAERYPSKGLISAIDSGKLPFHLIEESLLPGEDVLLAFGAYAGHIGRVRYKNIALAFTDRRLLAAGTLSIPHLGARDNMVSMKLDVFHSVVAAGISILIRTISHDSITIGNYSSEIRSALFDQIQGILEQYQGGGMPGAPVLPQSPAEEIRAYKALLDEGILTQAEFEAKKKQLLGL